MENINVSLEEFRLLVKAMYQLESITIASTEYTMEKSIERAKETLKEIKNLENINYKF